MKNNRMAGKGEHQKGFIKTIVIIVVALLIVSYFGLNLRQLADAPTTKDNFSYVATTTVTFWNKYLEKPATYVWNQIFLDLIWNPSIDHLKHLDTVDMSTSSSSF